MIRVTLMRDESDGTLVGYEVSGHADFAESGRDIVCAGVSAVTIGTANALAELLNEEPEVSQRKGLLVVKLRPQHLSSGLKEKSQLLLQSMAVMLESIRQEYDSYMTIHYKSQTKRRGTTC